MQRLLITVTVCLLLLSQIPNVFANGENVSKEIERIEVKENMKIIYYKNGLKEVFFTASASTNVGSSVGTAHVIGVPTPRPEPPDLKILKILRQIIDVLIGGGGVCVLLAWKILDLIKRQRRGRPRDYYGVEVTKNGY